MGERTKSSAFRSWGMLTLKAREFVVGPDGLEPSTNGLKARNRRYFSSTNGPTLITYARRRSLRIAGFGTKSPRFLRRQSHSGLGGEDRPTRITPQSVSGDCVLDTLQQVARSLPVRLAGAQQASSDHFRTRRKAVPVPNVLPRRFRPSTVDRYVGDLP